MLSLKSVRTTRSFGTRGVLWKQTVLGITLRLAHGRRVGITEDIAGLSHPTVGKRHQHGAYYEDRDREEPRSKDSHHHGQRDDCQSSE
jgi:hypothetical protein